MLDFLDHHNLWATLAKRTRLSMGRNLVAVPYLGKGAAKLLALARGDVLLCALSEANCRNGSVSPREVQVLQSRGVRVFIRENLHAKVYLMGTRAVVASANLSEHSQHRLDEAAIHTSDKQLIREIKDWFAQRMGEPVTPEWLAYCKDVYRPPKSIKLSRANANRRLRLNGRRIWLIGTHPMEFPASESSLVELGAAAAKGKLQNNRIYEVESVRWAGRSRFLELVRRGDVLIQRFENHVYPHGRILDIRRRTLRNGRRVTYIFYEAVKLPKTLTWQKFRAECERVGLRLGNRLVSREVRDPLQQNRLLSLTSPESK
jgi:hypothetical protein